MAGYTYGGNNPIQQAAQRQQRLLEELNKAREAERQARKLNRENQRIEQRIIETQNRTTRLIEQPFRNRREPLPEPRYGGPQGLQAAANEIQEYSQRKQAA